MSAHNGDNAHGGDEATGGEFAAIARIARALPAAPAGELWAGDDAAVLARGDGLLLLSTDVAVAGVHGDLALIGLDDFGWRALAAAVSDIAAMGGDPGRAVVAVAAPPPTDLSLLYEGLVAAADAHRTPIVGGDLSGAGAGGTVVVTVTVTGSVDEGPPPVRRSGAAPGDVIVLTGPLGASGAGLRALRVAAQRSSAPGRGATAQAAANAEVHRRPRARLAEGRLARLAGASAMIDVSDGLAADLGHVAEASGVGVVLDDVPCAPGTELADALGGGEDYELVITTGRPDELAAAFADAGLAAPLRIGVCVADPSVRTLAGRPLPSLGWEHPFD